MGDGPLPPLIRCCEKNLLTGDSDPTSRHPSAVRSLFLSVLTDFRSHVKHFTFLLDSQGIGMITNHVTQASD